MKGKYLLLVSLILAILTIGAVSAADDVDALAVDNTGDDQAVETPVEDSNAMSKSFGDSIYISTEDADLSSETDYSAWVTDYNYINGTVSFSINDQQKYSKYISSDEEIERVRFYNYLFDYQNLNAGNYSITASYLKNGASSPLVLTETVEFKYYTNIDYDDSVSVGETSYIRIDALKGSTGTATIYNYNDTTDKIGSAITTVTITNGEATIPISGFIKGENDFYLNYTINNENHGRYIYIYASENTAGYSATVTPQVIIGSDATVTFSGAKTKDWVGIYVDGTLTKDVLYNGGTLSESISGLALGQHQVSVRYSKGNDFYSNTFNVNVIQKPADVISLALKKATVKKSAKKLVLQATLKVNGKAANKKVVVFKFNGKTIKAKTNAKGIAKATVKKSILKKLKVGKKITYTAKYSTKTAKQTVKVKK